MITAAGLEKCNYGCAGDNSFRTAWKNEGTVKISLLSMSEWFDSALFRKPMNHSGTFSFAKVPHGPSN
jgi:hypothetical protein